MESAIVWIIVLIVFMALCGLIVAAAHAIPTQIYVGVGVVVIVLLIGALMDKK